jgi:hypothetical protein
MAGCRFALPSQNFVAKWRILARIRISIRISA